MFGIDLSFSIIVPAALTIGMIIVLGPVIAALFFALFNLSFGKEKGRPVVNIQELEIASSDDDGQFRLNDDPPEWVKPIGATGTQVGSYRVVGMYHPRD